MAIYRLTTQGHLPGGEIWNTTLHINHTAGQGADLLVTCEEAVTLLWQGPPTPADSIQQLVPTTIGTDELVLDQLTSTGTNDFQFRSALSLDGTSAEDMLPFQVSVGFSLRTDFPTRAGRGRGFLPPYALDTCVGGKLASTPQGQTALALKAMLDHINASTDVGVVVYHRVGHGSDKVLSVDVGDVFDTQRRRRNQLTEVRVSASLA